MPQDQQPFMYECQTQVQKMQLQIDQFSKRQEQALLNSNQDGCRVEDLEFYQMFCFILTCLCIALVLSLACIYFQMRRKINKLVQIHDFGLPENQLNQILKDRKEAGEHLAGENEETGEQGSATTRPLNTQQQSRDALIRIIKFQLDQYLLHSNANVAIEDLNYNFGDDKNYFDVKNPFKVNSQVTDTQASPSVHDIDIEKDSATSKKQGKRLSGQEVSVLQQFKHEYDLNYLALKESHHVNIERQHLDIKNLRMLQMFMQQLKQFLIMLQAADEKNVSDILKRYGILKKMWQLDTIKSELEETTTQIQAKQIKDPKVLANYPQIQIVLQILGIIMDDAQSMAENQKRMVELGTPSENLNSSFGAASSRHTDTRRSRNSNNRHYLSTPGNRRNVNILENASPTSGLGNTMRSQRNQQYQFQSQSPQGGLGSTLSRGTRMQSILKRPTPPLNLNKGSTPRSYYR